MRHADHHFVAIDHNNRYKVLIGNDGGVFTQTYNPSTDDWAATATNQNATLSVQQFYSIGTHPGNAAAIIGGTQDTIFPNQAALRSRLENVREVYALYGAKDALTWDIADAPHSFRDEARERAYAMLATLLK